MNDQNKRIGELLGLVFQTQAEAGAALGASQSTVARWLNVGIPPNFEKKYGPRMAAHGLNVRYIFDPTAPMKVSDDAMDAIGCELEILIARVEAVSRKLESLKTATQ